MASTTTCPKCNSSSFELKSNSQVKNCRHTLHFIQCISCGTAIGVISDRHDYLLELLAKMLVG